MQKRTIPISRDIFKALSDYQRTFVTKFYPDISINDIVILKEEDFSGKVGGGASFEVQVISIQIEVPGLKSNECILGIKPVSQPLSPNK